MKLEIGEKEYNLRLLCGKVRELRDAIKSDDLLDALLKAAPENNIETLAKAFRVMCIQPRLSKDSEACQVIDEYLAEGNTVMDFGNVLLEVLDDSGFLPQRGMAAKIREQTESAVQTMGEKLGEKPEEGNTTEFAGFKA